MLTSTCIVLSSALVVTAPCGWWWGKRHACLTRQAANYSSSQPASQPGAAVLPRPCLTRVNLQLHKVGALEGRQAAAAAGQDGHQLILQGAGAGGAARLLGGRGTDVAWSGACG